MILRNLLGRRFAPSLAAAFAALVVASPASAVTVDQSFLPATPTSALTVDGANGLRAQTFTVGTAGLLTGVRTPLAVNIGGFATDPALELTVGIYDFTAGGVIDIGAGPLASATTTPGIAGTGIFDFTLYETLFATSLAVSVGDTLAIVLSTSAPQNQGFFWAAAGDGYAGGSLWQEFGAGNGLTEVGTQDHAFETLMADSAVAPLPAGAWLLLSAFGVAAAVRRRRPA